MHILGRYMLLATVAAMMLLPTNAGALTVEDPEGDQRFRTGGGDLQAPDARWQMTDITGLEIREEPEGITFGITVAELEPPDHAAPFVDGVWRDLYFTFEAFDYRINIAQVYFFLPQWLQYGFYLDELSGGDAEPRRVAELDGEVLAGENRLEVFLPRDLIRGHGGNILSNGGELASIYMEAESQSSVYDRAPDEGTVSFLSTYGPVQEGPFRLSSADPLRASNGAAGSFVFPVRVENHGQETGTGAFVARDVPDAWQITVPSGTQSVAPGQVVDFPVLVTVPFNHVHGDVETFVLEFAETEDASSAGRIALGFHYTTTPQPAGHHSRLFLHARESGPDQVEPFMNTLEIDDHDVGGTVPRTDTVETYTWLIPLDPALALGLDFDVERFGHANFTFTLPAGMTPMEIWGDVAIVNSTHRTVIADLSMVTVDSLQEPANEVAYDSRVQVQDAADYMAFRPGSNLQLGLYVDCIGCYVGNPMVGPALHTGGILQLPLNEFYDEVADAFETATGLSIQATNDTTRRIAPGSSVELGFKISNPGESSLDVRLSFQGTEPDWIVTSPRSELRVSAGASQTVDWILAVPGDAAAAQRAEYAFIATDAATGQSSIAHAVVVVDPDGEEGTAAVPDAGAPAETTPALHFVLVALALAFLARRAPKA